MEFKFYDDINYFSDDSSINKSISIKNKSPLKDLLKNNNINSSNLDNDLYNDNLSIKSVSNLTDTYINSNNLNEHNSSKDFMDEINYNIDYNMNFNDDNLNLHNKLIENNKNLNSITNKDKKKVKINYEQSSDIEIIPEENVNLNNTLNNDNNDKKSLTSKNNNNFEYEYNFPDVNNNLNIEENDFLDNLDDFLSVQDSHFSKNKIKSIKKLKNINHDSNMINNFAMLSKNNKIKDNKIENNSSFDANSNVLNNNLANNINNLNINSSKKVVKESDKKAKNNKNAVIESFEALNEYDNMIHYKKINEEIIYLKILVFLHSYIHSILYLCNIYPIDIFATVTSFNLNYVKQCLEEKVIEYIDEFIESLRKILSYKDKKVLKTINILIIDVIDNKDLKITDKFVIDIKNLEQYINFSNNSEVLKTVNSFEIDQIFKSLLCQLYSSFKDDVIERLEIGQNSFKVIDDIIEKNNKTFSLIVEFDNMSLSEIITYDNLNSDNKNNSRNSQIINEFNNNYIAVKDIEEYCKIIKQNKIINDSNKQENNKLEYVKYLGSFDVPSINIQIFYEKFSIN